MKIVELPKSLQQKADTTKNIKVKLNNGEEVILTLDIPEELLKGEERDVNDRTAAYINNWLDNNMPFAVEWE